jgi:hypothetical protein
MRLKYPMDTQKGRYSRNTLDFTGLSARNKCVPMMVSVTACFPRFSGLVTTVTTYPPSDRFSARRERSRGGKITTEASLQRLARTLWQRYLIAVLGRRV